MMYVDLVTTKTHLRIDHCEEDDLLDSYIASASSAVKNYLKSTSPYSFETDQDDNIILDTDDKPLYLVDDIGDKVVNIAVLQATLILIGYFYRDRDNDEGKEYETGYLPRPVTALLYPLRDPACW